MNEITLNALINLFALFSAISESKKEDAVRNFSLYLHQHFGISDDNDYLKLFEELLDLYGVTENLPLRLIWFRRLIISVQISGAGSEKMSR
jgi:hypothetical protein